MDTKNEQSTEQNILEVAERLFLEKGFAMTSTTEIAKEVGCNQALIHYYYRTKDNLFNTIFEQKFKIFFQEIFEMKNIENLQFLDKLKYIIESHYDMIRSNLKLPLLIINELSRQPEKIQNLKEKLHAIPEQLFAKLDTELQAEITAGRIRSVGLIDLIITMISLNVAFFLLMPIAVEIIPMNESQKQMLIEHRRIEHVNLILNSLRP